LDIAAWLHDLDLSRYERTFRDNAIDVEVLAELTDADLEKLGVLLGHRKRLLRAIAALDSRPLAPAGISAAVGPPSRLDYAERRQITALFCDLVDSTALTSRLDPEDMRELMGAYHRCVAETVQPFGGFMARYMGDGALVYFGYPEAHEDDAEQAIRAGLELTAAIRAIRVDPLIQMQARIGIASGLVVMGDLLAFADVQERHAVGETLNLAARLQSVAEPGAVMIAQSTRRLVGNLFDCRDAGRVEFKGIPGPVQVWQVLRPSAIASRFEALHPTALTPLVGRQDDIELILGQWQQAKSGRGQVVLLAGEPGIGKSRVVVTVLEQIAKEPHIPLRYFCSPGRTNSALFPLISQIEHAAGFEREDDVRSKLERFDALMSRTSASAEDKALVGALLSLPSSGGDSWHAFPHQRKRKTLDALLRQLDALAHRKPVLIAFEDLHWADPTSVELLGRTIAAIRRMRVMVLISFRPDFVPPWIGQPQVTLLMLNRLNARDAGTIVERIAGSEVLAGDITREIVERTSGVPLFVEELTKAILEAGASELRARVALSSVPSPTRDIPATLNASLMARLDRLGSAKEVAQVGATIGRQFSHELLGAVARLGDSELHTCLDRLVQAGLLVRVGTPSDAHYLFKHALVQDAAYATLLRGRRQELHARIVNVLEEQFAETCEGHPEVHAHHCTEAGFVEKAVVYWGKAGRQSISRSALLEAVAQFRCGLDQIARLAPTPALRREQLILQVELAGTLVHIRGYAAPEVVAAFADARAMVERARELGEYPEDPLLEFSIMYGLWVANYVAIDVDMMRHHATEILALAGRQNTSAPQLIGHRLMGTSLVMRGEFEGALAHLDRAVALYQPDQHRLLAARFSQDIGMSSLSFRSWTLWHLGRPAAALADVEQLLEQARDLGQVPTLIYALFHGAVPEILCGRQAEAEDHVGELMSLVERHGLSFWKSLGLFLQGWCETENGRAADAVRSLHVGFSTYASTGSTLFIPIFKCVLARAYAQQGRQVEALDAVNEALAAAQRTNETWAEAELHRTMGELLMASPTSDPKQAESCFRNAIAIARRQGARGYELRAATSLAGLLAQQARPAQAYDVLAPVYAAFSEGFDTRDLEQARALLSTLTTAPARHSA
jgi:class 3 adenylate cyclase/predicted ATPase